MASDPVARPLGTIVTFYSYKGGTGRSMALANVGWLLAANGKRVLMVDWDLEAPGLHRFFHPLLLDSQLRSSRGLMDLVWDFALTAMTPAPVAGPDWQDEHADVLQYAIAIDWPFGGGGCLHMVPAGRQDSAYGTRVSVFDWQNFYDRLGGGAFLESVKRSMRARYDYVLIDSRTGLSDTAGICTVQMPDVLVCCFTLSDQSIEGAAAVAQSVLQQRPDASFRVLPVPMRVEDGEHRKLEAGRDHARRTFAPLLREVTGEARERYWGEVEVPYRKFYAYEEVLATAADRPHTEGSVLAALERLVAHLTNGEVTSAVAIPEPERGRLLAQFERGAPTGERRDFFISYSHEDSAWAEWIAWTLNGAGYTVFLDTWDLRPSDDRSMRLSLALERSERVIAVLSPAYVASGRAMADVAAAMGGESRTAGRLLPVLVAETSLPQPLDVLTYLDLRGVDEATARRLLLSGTAGGLRPSAGGTPAPGEPAAYPSAAKPSVATELPPAVPGFVGRTEVLDAIADGFDQAAASGQEIVQVLTGPPGVGKTEVAAAFARRVAFLERSVLWRTAGAPAGPPVDVGKLFFPLVVLDGADEPVRGIAASLGLTNRRVDVLVTSRASAWPGAWRVHRLRPLPVEDAAEVLLRSTGDGDHEAAAGAAVLLGCLPAALRLAAAYIGESGRSLAAYRELLATQPATLFDRHLVPVVGMLRAEIASVHDQSPGADFVLRAVALLGHEPVPVGLLAPPVDPEATGVEGAPQDELALDDAIQLLHQRGLLAREGERLLVSALVQAVMWTAFDRERTSDHLGLVLTLLARRLPEPDRPESWVAYGALAPHVLAAGAHAARQPGLAERAERLAGVSWTALLARTGRYLLHAGDPVAAATALDRAVRLSRSGFADAYTLAAARADQVEAARVLGRLDDAMVLLEGWSDRASPANAGAYFLARGTVLFERGEVLAARGLLESALAALREDRRWHGLVGRCERELGGVLALSRDQGARGLLESALARHERDLGVRHHEVARDLRELGIALAADGDLDGAQRAMERALWTHRSLLRPEHYDIGYDLWGMAVVAALAGDHERAQSLAREALSIVQAAFGPAHPDVGRILRVLAIGMRLGGRLGPAMTALNEALAILEAALGPHHPSVGLVVVDRARTLRETGDLDGARRAYQRATSIWSAVLGEDNPISRELTAERDALSRVVNPRKS